MECHQCNKPAIYLVGDKEIPLCLDCHLKLTQISQMNIEASERMINFLADHMDSTIGLPVSPRFPTRKTTNVGGVTLNNINVDNSTIGVLNSGNIQSVDVSVTSLNKIGNTELAKAIQELTNSVIASTELQNEAKNELIEILSVISSEATAPPDKQRKGVVKVLLDQFQNTISKSKMLIELWTTWGPIISGAFGC